MRAEAAGKPASKLPARRQIKNLPAEIRDELDRRVRAGEFDSYSELAEWLAAKGCRIGSPAQSRRGGKLERGLEAVKMATMQARAVIEAAPDDDDRINQALIRLVQQHLFTVLLELKSARPTGSNLSALARSVAAIARAAVMQKKAAEEMRAAMRDKINAAEKTVLGTARAAAGGAGLTSQAEESIRRALTEIAR